MNKLLRPLTLLTLVSLMLAVAGCKKSSGGSDSPTPEYYITATVNGKAWSANVVSPTLHAACVGIISSSNSVSLVLMAGVQTQGKDSTAIALVFPSNITLNKQTKFDGALYTAGAYVDGNKGYNSDPANKGAGSLTITSFDQTARVIEGNFTGTFGFVSGGSTTVKITDGKFKCLYTTQPNANPFPPNVKF